MYEIFMYDYLKYYFKYFVYTQQFSDMNIYKEITRCACIYTTYMYIKICIGRINKMLLNFALTLLNKILRSISSRVLSKNEVLSLRIYLFNI